MRWRPGTTRFLEFSEAWGTKYPAIARLWENAWAEFVPFLAFDVEIRKVICSANAIESVNARIRKAVRARGWARGWAATSTPWAPGPGVGVLLLYTDGLVEHRHEDIDVSLDRLLRLRLSATDPLDTLPDTVLDRLASVSEDGIASSPPRSGPAEHGPAEHLGGLCEPLVLGDRKTVIQLCPVRDTEWYDLSAKE